MDQKSRPEQKRAYSQASDTGWAPSPFTIGRLHRKASVEKVVWTWRSPNRICFDRAGLREAAARACSRARSFTTASGTGTSRMVPAPRGSPYMWSQAPSR